MAKCLLEGWWCVIEKHGKKKFYKEYVDNIRKFTIRRRGNSSLPER